MKIKTVLVIGANGMLGNNCVQFFESKGLQTIKITRKEFDICKDSIKNLAPYLKRSDFIINCSGIIKQVISKYKIDEILEVNSIFPRKLAKFCKMYNKKLFHITTDCVFSGAKGNYSENDIFDADDIYGISKMLGESHDCMTIRTSIIGIEKNKSNSLFGWAINNSNKKVNGYINHIWNGVTTFYLAEVLYNIIKSNYYKPGIFHVFSKEKISKFKLLKLFNEIFNLNLQIIPYKTEHKCDRSLTSIYSISKRFSLLSIKDQLLQMKEYYDTIKKGTLYD